jgi:hypothetical protein
MQTIKRLRTLAVILAASFALSGCHWWQHHGHHGHHHYQGHR